MKRRALFSAVLAAASLWTGAAGAQYRLRADAYFAAADPTTGLLVLTGETHQRSWLSAETVVWLGTGDHPGDVMVAAVRAREPNGYGEAKVGRILVTAGALRPVHIDGIDAIGRAPWGTSLEVFGGMPVVSDFQPRDYDWVVGGRASQRIGKYATLGLSYLHERQTGALVAEELGVDATVTPLRWLDAAFTSAVDLQSLQLSDARVALAARHASVRLELFAVRRSPSHLLPATSLFSALGDVPSQRVGGSLLWRAAPRLDVYGEGAVESLGGGAVPMSSTGAGALAGAELGGQGMLRTTLRLDDRGAGALGLEVRRQSVPDASWTGVRGTARIPLSRMFAASTELEIAVPDDPRGRGMVWPWGLVALRFMPAPRWEMAGALEAGASPTAVSEVSAIFRVAYVWSAK
jgi:hypothetical protein